MLTKLVTNLPSTFSYFQAYLAAEASNLKVFDIRHRSKVVELDMKHQVHTLVPWYCVNGQRGMITLNQCFPPFIELEVSLPSSQEPLVSILSHIHPVHTFHLTPSRYNLTFYPHLRLYSYVVSSIQVFR